MNVPSKHLKKNNSLRKSAWQLENSKNGKWKRTSLFLNSKLLKLVARRTIENLSSFAKRMVTLHGVYMYQTFKLSLYIIDDLHDLTGVGKSKKIAKNVAAYHMLKILGIDSDSPFTS